MDTSSAPHPAVPWLRHENGRFHEFLRALTEADWRKPTLCPGWSTAHVVGHMTGGAASYADRVEAARGGRIVFGLGARTPEEFDAKRAAIIEDAIARPAPERVARLEEEDRRLDDLLARLRPEDLDQPTWHRKGNLPVRGFLGQRLCEVVLHRRDIENDPDAPLETEAMGVLARVLEERIPRQFQGAPEPELTGRFRIETEAPAHAFTLEARGGALLPAPGAEREFDVRLRASAGDMVLLVTGRGDPAAWEPAGRLIIEGDREKAGALMRAVFRPI